jgi:hypothetical protein
MRHPRFFFPLLTLAAALGAAGLLSAACGPSTPADCYDYTTFNSTTPTVSFRTDVLPIFRNSCGLSMVCHGNPNPSVPAQHYYGPKNSDPAPSDTDIAAILAGAVGKAAVAEPDMKIIAAGDPANSFMMYKLDADPMNPLSVNCAKLTCLKDMSCGTGMPQAGDILPADKRDTIRRWIAQGAKDN